MAKNSRPSAFEAFEINIADAHSLTNYAQAFSNPRQHGMRKELQQQVCEALQIPEKFLDDLGCLENQDLFVVFKPHTDLNRGDFEDSAPLLRQAIVAGAAALETYVADKVMECIGPAIAEMPTALGLLPVTLAEAKEISAMKQSGRGIRTLLEDRISQEASTAPNKISDVMRFIGQSKWLKEVDKRRSVDPGTTERELRELTERRNRIAHSGDRADRGRKRVGISYEQAEDFLRVIEEVVHALEWLLRDQAGMARAGGFPKWDKTKILAEVRAEDKDALPVVERILRHHWDVVDHWYWGTGDLAQVTAVFRDGKEQYFQPYTIVAIEPVRVRVNLKWMRNLPDTKVSALIADLAAAGLCSPDLARESDLLQIEIAKELSDGLKLQSFLDAIEALSITSTTPDIAASKT